MPRKRKPQGLPVKELGEFEFYDVYVSKTRKLMEKKRTCQLEFSCFESSPVDQGETSNVVNDPCGSSHSRSSEVDDLASVSDIDDDITELNNYSKRRLQLFNSWERQRKGFLKTYSDNSVILNNAVCHICGESNPEYRCKDCGLNLHFCLDCLVKSHRTNNQLHIPEKWQLVSSVFSIPGHINCPGTYLKSVIIVNSTGFQHNCLVQFCQCRSEASTLVTLGLWPATPTTPLMAFQFSLMESLESLFLNAKVSVQKFCQSFTDYSDYPRIEVIVREDENCSNLYHVKEQLFIKPQEVYRNLLDSFEEYRHFKFNLRNLKHICRDRDGEEVCPACPKRDGTLFESVDALFGLPRKRSSGNSVKPPVRQGLLFGIQEEVDDFVNSYHETQSPNDCHNFLAGHAIRSKQRYAGLDETGVLGMACRHEYPKRFVNLRHGERFSYAVWMINNLVAHAKDRNLSVNVLYDVACILRRHLENSTKHEDIATYVNFAIPIFHAYGHKAKCQILYSPRRLTGFGLTDGEVMERMWSFLRGFGSITKEMTPSRRIDALSDCLLHYARLSRSKLGERLRKRMLRAAELKIKSIAVFEEMVKSVPDFSPTLLENWIKEEQEYFCDNVNVVSDVAKAESWREQYFSMLQKFYCLRDELTQEYTDENEVMTKELQKMEKRLHVIERRQKMSRWKKTDEVYKQEKVTFLEGKISHVRNLLTTAGREFKFLTNLKSKYADGQAIASRLEKRIRKQSRAIVSRLKELRHVSKQLSDSGIENDDSSLTFTDVTSGLLLVDYSQDTASLVDGVPAVMKHDMIESHHLIKRCEEEKEIVEMEMVTVLHFYMKDVDDLQNCSSQDDLSDGEKCLIIKALTEQKIKFTILLDTFKEFVNLELMMDEPSSYVINTEHGDLPYVNRNSENSDDDDSDADSYSEESDDDIE